MKRVDVSVVEERGTSIGLLQSHVEWRDNSGSVSAYILVVWHVS